MLVNVDLRRTPHLAADLNLSVATLITVITVLQIKHSTDTKQVAQLWQRAHTKLDWFSIHVQRYSQNHKIAFLGHPMGATGAIQALYITVLMQINFIAEFHQQNASFTRDTAS